jgi:hypothetical protein
MMQKDKSKFSIHLFLVLISVIRFEGQRQSIDHYGRQSGQDSQEKHEFKSLSVNPAEREAAKKAAAAAKPADDDDVDLFGEEDEEESEQTKQRLAAYAAKKSNSTYIELLG